LNLTEYTHLLSKPESVNDKQTLALEQIVTEFPFFQSARALRLKGLYNQNSFQYNYALKVTAAFTTDRSVLFDFITSDTFTAIHKGLYEQKLAELYGIEVKESVVIAEEENTEPMIDKVEQSILTSIRESDPGYRERAKQTPFEEEIIEIRAEEIIPETVEITEIVEAVIPAPEKVVSIEELDKEEIVPELVNDMVVVEETVDTGKQPGQTSEAKLDIGKPLEFSKEEKHSFQEWLQLSKIQPIQREEIVEETLKAEPDQSEQEEQKAKKKALIDQFIKANPKIPPVKQDAKLPVFEHPKEDNSALMTETLARVYLEQKKYQKAIQAYEILILKYPEKSTFFADRISEVKNLQQNNT